nr:MAG TPA: hypothetical protein [Caudoviricetes sp.]
MLHSVSFTQKGKVAPVTARVTIAHTPVYIDTVSQELKRNVGIQSVYVHITFRYALAQIPRVVHAQKVEAVAPYFHHFGRPSVHIFRYGWGGVGVVIHSRCECLVIPFFRAEAKIEWLFHGQHKVQSRGRVQKHAAQFIAAYVGGVKIKHAAIGLFAVVNHAALELSKHFAAQIHGACVIIGTSEAETR